MHFTWTCFSDLTMEIVRYRLIGPQSHAVLADILEAATECDVRDFGPKLADKKELWECVCLALLIALFQEKSRSHPSSLWWPEHCRDKNKMNLHKQQADVYQTLKGLLLILIVEIIHITVPRVFPRHDCVMRSGVSSTGELPPGTVLGLTVDDPRLTLPSQKGKALACKKPAEGKV